MRTKNVGRVLSRMIFGYFLLFGHQTQPLRTTARFAVTRDGGWHSWKRIQTRWASDESVVTTWNYGSKRRRASKRLYFKRRKIVNITRGELNWRSRLPAGRRNLVCPYTRNKHDFTWLWLTTTTALMTATCPKPSCDSSLRSNRRHSQYWWHWSSAPTTTHRGGLLSLRLGNPNARYPYSPLKILKTFLFEKMSVSGFHIIRQLFQTINLD